MTSTTLTKKTSTGTASSICYRYKNMVCVSGIITGFSNQVASGNMFNIPSGYRPKSTLQASMSFLVGSTRVPYLCGIETGGNVVFSFSSVSTMDAFYFNATYPV